MFTRGINVILMGGAEVKVPTKCPKCGLRLSTCTSNLQVWSKVDHWAHENEEGDVENDGQEDWHAEEVQCKGCEYVFKPTADELRKAYNQIREELDKRIAALDAEKP